MRFWNASGRAREGEEERGRALGPGLPAACVDTSGQVSTRARAEPGNRLRGPHSREPRRADVTPWQMLLFGLQWQSSSTVGCCYLPMRSCTFLVHNGPGLHQSKTRRTVSAGYTSPSRQGREGRFPRLNSRPDQKSPIVIGKPTVYRLSLTFMLPCSVGVPALFRKEFMVSWPALGDEHQGGGPGLSCPHWLPDSTHGLCLAPPEIR